MLVSARARISIFVLMMPPKRRLKRLDVLRAIAILLVLGEHGPLVGNPVESTNLLRRIGWTGVDLFFVLSGFLVSGLLFAELKSTGRIRMSRFLLRRGFKIYPGYYVLIAYFAVRQIAAHRSLGLELIPLMTFMQNYVHVAQGQINAVYLWSIAVEEHFYLLLPLLLIALTRREVWPTRDDTVVTASDRLIAPLRALPLIIALVCALVLCIRVANYLSLSANMSETPIHPEFSVRG